MLRTLQSNENPPTKAKPIGLDVFNDSESFDKPRTSGQQDTLASWTASIRSNRERVSHVIEQHRKEKKEQFSLVYTNQPSVGRSLALASRGLKTGFEGLALPQSKQTTRATTLLSPDTVNIENISGKNIPERTKFKIAHIGLKLEARLNLDEAVDK